MWYLVLSRTLRSADEMEPDTAAHRAWLDDQHRAGRMLFSGPTSDGAFGVYVLLAPDHDAARRLAGEDPYHVRGHRQAEVLEWSPRRAFRLDKLTINDVTAMASQGR
jgi:uncharacterized protein YciI